MEEYRVKSNKKYVDEMLCILPFSFDFFKNTITRCITWHPTVDAIAKAF